GRPVETTVGGTAMSEQISELSGGVVREAKRPASALSHAERLGAGADVVRKTFGDAVNLITSDGGGPKIVSDVYISVIFWGKDCPTLPRCQGRRYSYRTSDQVRALDQPQDR